MNQAAPSINLSIRAKAPLGYTGMLKSTSEVEPLGNHRLGLKVTNAMPYSIPQVLFRHRHVPRHEIGIVGWQKYGAALAGRQQGQNQQQSYSTMQLYWKGLRWGKSKGFPQYRYRFPKEGIDQFGLDKIRDIIKTAFY